MKIRCEWLTQMQAAASILHTRFLHTRNNAITHIAQDLGCSGSGLLRIRVAQDLFCSESVLLRIRVARDLCCSG